MPRISDRRVSVSKERAPRSPDLYLWYVEAAGQPRSARCSTTVNCQAAATLKKVRSAGPDRRLRASGSGRTRTSVNGDPFWLRLTRTSICGYATPNLDSWKDRPFTPAWLGRAPTPECQRLNG